MTAVVRTSSSVRACTVVRRLVQSPAPGLLWLHGPAGVGKSFLVAAAIAERHPTSAARDVIQTTGETLIERFIATIRADKPLSTISSPVGSLLVVDHLDAMSGKPRTQSELGRFFVRSVESGVRVIATSSLSPGQMPAFASEVRRLRQCRIVSMERPTGADLMRVARSVAEARGVRIERRTLLSIAAEARGDFGRGIGALTRYEFGQRLRLA